MARRHTRPPIQQPSKEEKKFKQMVDDCVRNSELRRKDPREHAAWRESYIKSLRLGEKEITSLSNKIAGPCYKKSIDDSKWKSTYSDNEELKAREILAQKEVDNKRKRIAPAYNKGAVQYITSLKDLPTLGRKT